MARVKKGGRDFKIGNPGGPGRPQSSPELKAARKLTKTAFEETANRFLHMTRDELSDAKRDRERTTLELIVIAILEKAKDWGDNAKLEWLLRRLVGDVPTEVKLTDKRTDLTPEERQKRIDQLLAMRAKVNGQPGK